MSDHLLRCVNCGAQEYAKTVKDIENCWNCGDKFFVPTPETIRIRKAEKRQQEREKKKKKPRRYKSRWRNLMPPQERKPVYY